MLGQRQQSSVDSCELSVLEEQQDFHGQPIVDVGSLVPTGEIISVSDDGASMQATNRVGHGSALVESIAFNRRVVGSTPALAAM